jgi:hypothetical protein
LSLLETQWRDVTLPEYFAVPNEPEKRRLWERCLRSCEDYFGSTSPEYRLLAKGIVVHYGRMPGLMARLLIEVTEERIVSLVMATSTLSEGVNLPFETILIPSLQRWGGPLTSREFGNLVGRAGRPGVSTEGRALVLLFPNSGHHNHMLARRTYSGLVSDLARRSTREEGTSTALSPLAQLLGAIWAQWCILAGSDKAEEFYHWLEETAPLDAIPDEEGKVPGAVNTLDTLDSIILSALVEVEQLSREELSTTELESRLQRIWKRSYACCAVGDPSAFEAMFLHRGHALLTRIYPESDRRRKLYRTCLPPRSGDELLRLYGPIRTALAEGREYAAWGADVRLAFIERIVEMIGGIPKFRYEAKVGRRFVPVNDVLAWWLLPAGMRATPQAGTSRISPNHKQVSEWIKFISSNLIYRFCWGLGSVISLATDEMHEGKLVATRLEDWPRTGLPWIAFWLKELMTWGTLDPVAAFLLSTGKADTRAEAEQMASGYYDTVAATEDVDDRLNAKRVRLWAETTFNPLEALRPTCPPDEITVQLIRDFRGQSSHSWRVLPVRESDRIVWTDPAGFPLAESKVPVAWNPGFVTSFDFILDSQSRKVLTQPYV